MQRWIVILKDEADEAKKSIRRERFDEHFGFLKRNFHRIVFSCGLKDTTDASEPPYGGFWMVEAASREEVVGLLNEDPYFKLGLRDTIDIYKAHEGFI